MEITNEEKSKRKNIRDFLKRWYLSNNKKEFLKEQNKILENFKNSNDIERRELKSIFQAGASFGFLIGMIFGEIEGREAGSFDTSYVSDEINELKAINDKNYKKIVEKYLYEDMDYFKENGGYE
jgi:hypothetical protein